MKYRSYKAYVGRFEESIQRYGLERILEGINRRKEKIITVNNTTEDYLVIITLGQDDG
jgi:hypothetical protein